MNGSSVGEIWKTREWIIVDAYAELGNKGT